MKLGVLFSGGKDSTYALYLSLQQGFDVTCLVTLLPKSPDSYMFHYPNIKLTSLQAEAIGLPLVTKETEARKEEELEDLDAALREAKTRFKIAGIITGAIDSDYQKTRIERVAETVGIRSFTPLWRKNPVELLKEQIACGFKAIVCGVYAQGFDKSWLGKPLAEGIIEAIARLQKRFGVHPSGEGGEYESLVLDGPVFRSRLKIEDVAVDWDAKTGSGTYKILSSNLELKNRS